MLFKKYQKHFDYSRGLTFIEMLVTVAIFTIIMIAITDSVRFFYRANTSSLEQTIQINSARRGVEFMVRDIREAQNSESGAHPIASMSSTTLTFYSDTDADDDIERIHYELTDTTLFRNVIEPTGSAYIGPGVTTTVSEHVRNFEEPAPVFEYRDQNDNLITDYTQIGDVRSVRVNMIVNILPIRAPEEFTLSSSATIRNLRDE